MVIPFHTNSVLLFAEHLKTHGLSDRHSADANDGAVHSCGVLMRTNNRLQHSRIGTPESGS